MLDQLYFPAEGSMVDSILFTVATVCLGTMGYSLRSWLR